MQVRGTTISELVREESGDGVVPAVDVGLDVARVADPQGHRAVITLDGTFPPCRVRCPGPGRDDAAGNLVRRALGVLARNGLDPLSSDAVRCRRSGPDVHTHQPTSRQEDQRQTWPTSSRRSSVSRPTRSAGSATSR
ncbi:hypothetical protein [Pseudonocardia spirodelae]|uniref:cyanase n=1 Tax=Pseudonocardia spirodelae TaxID=3133431 RepID=UPI003BF48001